MAHGTTRRTAAWSVSNKRTRRACMSRSFVTAGHVAAAKRARVGDPHPRSPPAGVILQVPFDHEQTGLEQPARASRGFWIFDFGFWIESKLGHPIFRLLTSFRRCSVFVRILEKGAHLRRNHRHFPRCALFESRCASSNEVRHLRSRAEALHPVPFARKVMQALASASIALLWWQNESHRQTRWQVEERWAWHAQKKSRALDSGTAPHRRDLQLVAVPYLIDSLPLSRILSFASLILRDALESFHSKIFLALCRSQAPIDFGLPISSSIQNPKSKIQNRSIQCSCLMSPEKFLLPIVTLTVPLRSSSSLM